MKKTDKLKMEFEKFKIYISEDKRNIILVEFQEGGIKKGTDVKGPDKWVEIGYFGKMEHLISTMVQRAIKIPEGPLDEQLKAILEELRRVEKSLLEQMKVVE